jgi:2-succinyl-6-hydroxy-2,4-cyclohexadiene-1-carboxylate synthase
VRVVLVPGFTQTARSWDPVIRRLPADLDVIALDVPEGLDFRGTARALGEAGKRGVYVGYSMGGRLCLQLALDHSDLVDRLVLVSTSPGIPDPTERAARRDVDREWVRVLEDGGVDAFYERWLAQPLFASLSPDAAELETRIRNRAVLAHQLRALGQGAMPSLWERLGDLSMRVDLAVGGLDTKYVEIAGRMCEQIGDATLHVVEGAGHAVHLEQPAALGRVLSP